MNRLYSGTRDRDNVCIVHVAFENAEGEPVVRALLNQGVESPAGFDWGYDGCAPRDLAYSILLDHFEQKDRYAIARKKAQEYHRAFAYYVIAKLSKKQWTMGTAYVDEMLAERCSFQPAGVAL